MCFFFVQFVVTRMTIPDLYFRDLSSSCMRDASKQVKNEGMRISGSSYKSPVVQ